MNQSNFNFTNAKKAYEVRFYALPQVLLQGERYKNLSDSAILLYSILRDRLSYSLRSNWVDEDGNVYFIFTNQELKELRHWSNDKINKIKKELENANLLLQKRTGFNPKTGKNEPNRLYLADLEVSATDVYVLRNEKGAETLDMSGNPKIGNPQETVETLATSGNPKIGNPQENISDNRQTLATNGNPKIGHNLDNTNYLDTNRDYKETAQLDFSTANFSNAQIEKQNQDLVLHAKEFLTTEDEDGIPFEPETIKLLSLWANNPKQIRKFIGIILNARRDAQELHQDQHLFFMLDDEPELQTKITQTLRRYFNALRSDDKQIKNYENYLYITMRNMFENYGNSKLQREYKLEHSTNQIAKNNLSMDLGTEYLS
ncbi:plasmid replication initiation protein [Lactiplantibacillus paraplantarum]|uniref:replication initiator protein A n=1 Tax=Lactiplantibacillus paraplantarum TaxID=60520 RepID=UPI0021A4AB66|nr:replication initiator protein A [Lactiplantibacillus paraplantarum]MCT4455978.1 plasmid replication initiation protein [Lactiplantibacillus paraplantarum]